MKKIKVCPICGTEMKIDTSAVCTSIPPMYRCVCPSCNCLDFIKTSEYDQYKEEPSLPSDLDEAAEKYLDGIFGKGKHEDFYIQLFKAGAEWGSDHLRDSTKMVPDGLYEAAENIYKTPFGTRAEDFIAGAEWMAGQGWISVDERLPEMDEEVIVLTDEFDTALIYKIGFGHIVDVERCIDYNGWNCPGVKFWMPMPKIPNE